MRQEINSQIADYGVTFGREKTNATTSKVSPLGGSSPLVDAAVSAAKKWKYEPAFGWTNMEVRLQFIP
jgi:hypothetical protein